jgi:RimJ/RimL family protein N-acetyltransferase
VRHNLHVEGYAFGLRPVDLRDASFILSLRTDPELSRYINPTSDRLDDQEDWIRHYFERPNDNYWVITRRQTGQAEGAVAIYDIDTSRRQAEWGRWVLKKGSLAAVESALLVYRAAFRLLDLDRIYCRTVSANRSVVSFHAACGLETRPNHGLRVRLRGTTYNVVEQFLTKDRWRVVEPALTERACSAARLLSR